MTGSYNNCFKIYDLAAGSETTIELAKSRPKPPVTRPIAPPPDAGGAGYSNGFPGSAAASNGGDITMGDTGSNSVPPVDIDEIDYAKKVLYYSWHPYEDVVAVAGLNNLYIYNAVE